MREGEGGERGRGREGEGGERWGEITVREDTAISAGGWAK